MLTLAPEGAGPLAPSLQSGEDSVEIRNFFKEATPRS
jgi:hypothetical protein